MAEQQRALQPIEEVKAKLDLMAGQFKAVLPPHVDVEKFTRVVMMALNKSPSLLNLDRKTLFQACLNCAQDGLLPDGRDAALVPFKGKIAYMPMISGILKKVRNSGELASFSTQIIFENDKFEYWVDSDGEHMEHRPLLFGERGKVQGAYAIAKTKDGAVYIEVMTLAQIEKVRGVSAAKNNGPWVDWWDEMARKTVARRLSKRLPMSTDLERVIQRDDELYDFKRDTQDKGAELTARLGLAPTIQDQAQLAAPSATPTMIASPDLEAPAPAVTPNAAVDPGSFETYDSFQIHNKSAVGEAASQ